MKEYYVVKRKSDGWYFSQIGYAIKRESAYRYNRHDAYAAASRSPGTVVVRVTVKKKERKLVGWVAQHSDGSFTGVPTEREAREYTGAVDHFPVYR